MEGSILCVRSIKRIVIVVVVLMTSFIAAIHYGPLRAAHTGCQMSKLRRLCSDYQRKLAMIKAARRLIPSQRKPALGITSMIPLIDCLKYGNLGCISYSA